MCVCGVTLIAGVWVGINTVMQQFWNRGSGIHNKWLQCQCDEMWTMTSSHKFSNYGFKAWYQMQRHLLCLSWYCHAYVFMVPSCSPYFSFPYLWISKIIMETEFYKIDALVESAKRLALYPTVQIQIWLQGHTDCFVLISINSSIKQCFPFFIAVDFQNRKF